MDRQTIGLAEAKARLSELTERAEHGEEIVITKRGRPVAVLTPVRTTRRPLDVAAARALVRRLPHQPESSSELVRRMRDEERY
ncbi:MAG: type II toxin-antitoxin system Phd/YefM family antitoxin [Trueperaceae bacterium]|nr:type II toxin-antitoxin system Phd/YefM family antitoxin [Trueperaceae bacterium]